MDDFPTSIFHNNAGHAVKPISGDSNLTADDNASNPSNAIIKNSNKTKKKRKKPQICNGGGGDGSDPLQKQNLNHSSSSCSSSSSFHTDSRGGIGIRVSGNHRRNPRVLIGSVKQKQSDVDALALPLGMSIAAFVAQVLERKEAAGKKMSVDHLCQICNLAVRESLSNVFGNKFECFINNFEKSFQSTLMTLRLISESSEKNGEQPGHLNEDRGSDLTFPVPHGRERFPARTFSGGGCQSEANIDSSITQEGLSTHCTLEELEDTGHQIDSVGSDVSLGDNQNNQQLACVSASQLHSEIMLSTFEKSVMEQTRSNDLKTFEIGLLMKKMKLKETELALNCDSNFLQRLNLSMGISKASFRTEKFKTELADTRHVELLKKCIDCLVAGLLIMLASLAYGTYVYSHQRLIEVTESCIPAKETNSWWIPKPMSSFSSGFQILNCQVQVLSRMLFGALMILAIAYLLMQRSASSRQTMPVTFILLLLGIGCGFAGKFCIDTLGGSGKHWLLYWEVLCSLHFFSNVCTSALFLLLHGPVTASKMSKDAKLLCPYWIRRLLFYATLLVFLPLLCGFMPFAGPGEWSDHFSSLIIYRMQTSAE